MFQRKTCVSFILALGLAAAPALAQQQDSERHPGTPEAAATSVPYGGMMGYAGMGSGMMGYGGMGRSTMGWGGLAQAMCNAMTGHVEGRLAYIKAELKITQTQELLWNAYAAAARENANTMLAHCTAMMGQRGSSTTSLPVRLDQHEQLMAAQLEAMRTMNKALKPFYAALSPEQKKTADQLMMSPMGMM
jgi:LTXXQ motif family protein